MRGHVLVECMSSGSYWMMCFAERHVLLERACLASRDVLYK